MVLGSNCWFLFYIMVGFIMSIVEGGFNFVEF